VGLQKTGHHSQVRTDIIDPRGCFSIGEERGIDVFRSRSWGSWTQLDLENRRCINDATFYVDGSVCCHAILYHCPSVSFEVSVTQIVYFLSRPDLFPLETKRACFASLKVWSGELHASK
jgi:hypothetical protein